MRQPRWRLRSAFAKASPAQAPGQDRTRALPWGSSHLAPANGYSAPETSTEQALKTAPASSPARAAHSRYLVDGCCPCRSTLHDLHVMVASFCLCSLLTPPNPITIPLRRPAIRPWAALQRVRGVKATKSPTGAFPLTDKLNHTRDTATLQDRPRLRTRVRFMGPAASTSAISARIGSKRSLPRRMWCIPRS